MHRQEKIDTVAELKETLPKAASLILADFRGVSAPQADGLRSEMRKAACVYRVVKNTLVKRAIAETPMAGLADLFRGPTAIAFSFEDPVAPAKVLDKVGQELKALKVKGGYIDGEILDPDGVKALAKMKGKDELRAELLMTLSAPAQNFVALLNAAPQNFLYLLGARERALGEG